jgi:beta-exotoxin I transport system permease protein
MKGPLVLIAHSLKRVRMLVLAMAVLLGAFQVFLILAASAFQRSKALEGMTDLLPPFVREFLGASATAFLSFSGMVCQGYFHPIVLVSLTAMTIAISTMPTSEIESGFMDLILSRPIARHWLITRSIIVMVICTVTLLGMMLAGTWLGLSAFTPIDIARPSSGSILSLAINLGLLMLCWSGVAMAIGAASRRRSVAGTIVGLLALLTFLLDFLGHAWRPAEAMAWLSPFRYYNALELIRGVPLQSSDLLVLGTIAVASFATAYVIFAARDLAR